MRKSLVFFGIVMAICSIIGGFAWPYIIESWAIVWGKNVQVAFWQGALLGFCPFLGQATIPIAVVTWILMLFF